MIASTGGISDPFDIVQVVIGFASQEEGCGGTIKTSAVYAEAYKRLLESASALKAEGVIFISFQNRFAVSQACGSSKQVFEVFSWGTAIRIRR
jgi:uncharacterized protein YbjQ (UPF0145 family)